MVATAIVLLCTLASAPHKAEVTFNDPPARLENLLASVSETADVRLNCSKALADRVLLVKVDGVELQDLLDRIAYVVDGKWEQIGQRKLLVVDESELRKRRLEHYQINSIDIDKGLKELMNDVPDDFSEDQALKIAYLLEDLAKGEPEMGIQLHWERQKAYAGIPAARLGMKLFASILTESPEELPLAKPGRVVYTNLRNSPYKKMTVSADLLSEYEKGQAAWDKVVAARSLNDENYVYNQTSMMASQSDRPAQSVFLMAHKGSKYSQFQVSIGILDDQGAVKSGAEFSFPTSRAQRRYETITSAPLVGTPLSFSEDATRYAQASSVSVEPPVRITQNDPLYSKVIDPVKHDPLGFALGELVEQVLSRDGTPIVAELSDEMNWLTMRAIDEGGLTDATALRHLEQIEDIQVESHEDGFVTSRFRDPDIHEENFPRSSLKELAQCMHRLGFVDLRTLVLHGFPDGRDLGSSVPFSLLRVLAPGYERHLQTFEQALPQYAAALTPAEREALLSGKEVMVGQLTRQSKEQLNTLLIGNRGIFGQAVGFRNVRVPYTLMSVLMFPMGLPNNVSLRIDAKTGPGMAAFLPKVDNMTNWYVFGGEGMALGAIGSRIGKTNVPFRIWKGDHLSGWFKLEQEGQTLIQYMVDLVMIDLRGEPLSVSGLSEDQQKRIEQARVSTERRTALEKLRRKPPPPS